jgi:hypothetical protein
MLIHQRQNVPGCVKQYGACLREPQAFTPTLQQRSADDLFQPPDLLAQGGLGDEHPLGGVRKAARVGQSYEVTQVPQLNTGRHSAVHPGQEIRSCLC